MKAGNVFLGGDYATLIAQGKESLPDEAVSGPFALGTTIMVCRDSLDPEYRLPGLSEWFPARVCLPPPVAGQWYRWYDPYIWYETEGPIHREGTDAPQNMAYCGKLWSPNYRPERTDQWAYPLTVWRTLFAEGV